VGAVIVLLHQQTAQLVSFWLTGLFSWESSSLELNFCCLSLNSGCVFPQEKESTNFVGSFLHFTHILRRIFNSQNWKFLVFYSKCFLHLGSQHLLCVQYRSQLHPHSPRCPDQQGSTRLSTLVHAWKLPGSPGCLCELFFSCCWSAFVLGVCCQPQKLQIPPNPEATTNGAVKHISSNEGISMTLPCDNTRSLYGPLKIVRNIGVLPWS
jgi:hypothetical protein